MRGHDIGEPGVVQASQYSFAYGVHRHSHQCADQRWPERGYDLAGQVT